MYEYAITAGEGTLIEYGKCGYRKLSRLRIDMQPGWAMTFAYCGDSCKTGE